MENGHQSSFCNRLWELQCEGRYTDFKIMTADEQPRTIPCHKVVMAAGSPFFEVMLDNEMEETLTGSVDLPFDGDTIQLVLKYIYTGENVINRDSVIMLYDAANFLQVATLIRNCEEYLKKEISSDICLEIWIIAKKLRNNELMEIARSMVLQEFNVLCTFDNMSIVSLEDLQDVLLDPFLNCTGHFKCRAAWIWLAAHEHSKPQEVENLLKTLLNAKNVDNRDILNVCDYDDIPTDIEVERDKIQEMWDSACKKLWISADIVPYSKHDINYNLDECAMLVGSDKKSVIKLLAFDFQKKKWYDFEAQERDLGYRYALCSRGSALYLSGGTSSNTRFLCFNGELKKWFEEQDMPVGREHHVMVSVDHKIFVLGGSSRPNSSLWDVHYYDCSNYTWFRAGQIACPVLGACAVQMEDNILLLGGSSPTENKTQSDIIQYYTMSTQTSAYLDKRLPFKAKSLNMATTIVDSMIYIFHKGIMYRLEPFVKIKRDHLQKNLPGFKRGDPKLEQVHSMDIEHLPVKGFVMTSFGTKVILLGGEDDNFTVKKSIIQFDTLSRTSVLLPLTTPEPMKDFSYTKVLVSKTWALKELEC